MAKRRINRVNVLDDDVFNEWSRQERQGRRARRVRAKRRRKRKKKQLGRAIPV